MPDTSALEWVLRRDKVVTLAAIVSAAALAWLYILSGAGMKMPAATDAAMSGTMSGMASGTAMGAMASMATGAAPMAWTPGYALLILLMWAAMMVAMMLPSAAPMILIHASVARKGRAAASPHAATAAFAAGYIAIWVGFSAIAATLQWALGRAAMLLPTMAATSATLGGAVLIAAGIYQFTPLKDACLGHCRSPLEFLSAHWRRGPFAMGLRHGVYCLGCCWALMLLLFVGGVMNPLWIVGLAILVMVEKLAPRGRMAGYAAGVVLIAWGGWTLALVG